MERYFPILAFLTAFGITYFSIPAIIRLSLVKKLYDEPDQRKLHNRRTSALGGVGIFGGMIFAFIFFTYTLPNPSLNSVLAALIILFVTGVKDDLYPMAAWKKMGAQLMAVLIVIFQGDIRIDSFYGILGIWELPYWSSAIISLFFFVGIINSVNFIDGINGLSGGIGALVATTYAYYFWQMQEPLFAILALCIVGALLGFLRYNFRKGLIFMGDSGSLVLGFLLAVLTVYFIRVSVHYQPVIFENLAAMVVAYAILILPIFDTLRVVLIRVFILRKPPYQADRNHIHHALLDIGFSHVKASLTLYFVNGVIVVLAIGLLEYTTAKYVFLIISTLAFVLSQIPFLIKKRLKKSRS